MDEETNGSMTNSATKKKLEPLPVDSTQVKGIRPAANKKNIELLLKKQRDAAKQRAVRLKAGVQKKSREELIEMIATASEEMQSFSLQSNAAVNQLQSSFNEIMKNSESSAMAAKQASNAVEKIRRITAAIVANADACLSKINLLKRLIMGTMDGVHNLIGGIAEAVKLNRSSESATRKVEQHSANIRNIVGTVAKVADQINLFALNAALESSRAKEHGVAFSVVADEVRKLAMKADQAASSINSTIDGIVNAVNVLVDNINNLVADGVKWTAHGNDLLARMQQCVDDITTIQEGSNQTKMLALQIDQATGETNKNSEGYR